VEDRTDKPARTKNIDERELFEHIIESSTDFAIFTTDLDGIVTSWNTGARRLFGYSDDEILGINDDVTFTPEDQAISAPTGERCQALAEGRALDDRWHMRKDGSRFWASGLLMPLRNPFDGFVKITRDRTEQYRADERLRESEARFRLLATAIPQLVFCCRPNGNRSWGSPQWCDFVGMSLDESLGFGWLEAVHPDDRGRTLNAWAEAQATGEYYCEHRVRRSRDGEYLWHQTRAKPVNHEAGTDGEWVGTMTDIDNLRGLQDRQQVLMAELLHRTRNLLAVVQAIASQTRRTSASVTEFGNEFAGRLRALSRVQNLLSRIDEQDVDLRSLVEAELHAHGGGDTASGKVEIEGPPVALPATSAQAFGLAVHELATNAVKYGALTQPDGKLKIRWNIEADEAERRVVFEWTESGVKMLDDGPPKRRGYGSELIERALPYQLRAKTDLQFGPDGVRCAIVAPVRGDEDGPKLR
jgi:PAS domain S-box-containing protein